MLIETSSQITIMHFFYSNPRSIQASTPEKRDPHLARAEEQAFINSFKTDMKTFAVEYW